MEIFEICGRKIEVDEYLESYAKIRCFYHLTAETICLDFDKFWDKYCKNIHEVVELAPCFFENVISYFVRGAIEGLVHKGIYDVDEETYFCMKQKEYFNCSFMDSIVEQYTDVIRTRDQGYAYAEYEYGYNSVSTVRWSGGGFGIVGAIKGAATSTVLNCIGDAVAKRKATKSYNKRIEECDIVFENRLKQLYDSGIYDYLREHTWKLCMNAMYAFLDELEKNDLFEYPDLDKDKAEIIYKNTIKYGNEEIFVKNLIDCIKLWPFDTKYYSALYKREDLSEDDLTVIDMLAEFMCIKDDLVEETIEIRVGQLRKRNLLHMAEYKEKSIIERACFVKECFEAEIYGGNILDEDHEAEIIAFVNEEARNIATEINKYIGNDLEEKIDKYVEDRNYSDEEKKALKIAIKCEEISKKYPFFETFDDDDYNLQINESYFEFVNSMEEFFALMDEKPLNKMPKTIVHMLEKGLLLHFNNGFYDAEWYDCFEEIQDKSKEVFGTLSFCSKELIKETKENNKKNLYKILIHQLNTLLDDKNKAIRIEIQELIEGYRDKNENELKAILLKLDDYPIYLTNNVKPQIENKLNALVNDSVKCEIENLITDYHTKDVKNINDLISIINEKYSMYPFANDYIEKLHSRVDELENEELDKLTYLELINKYNDISSNNKLSECEKIDAINKIKEKTIAIGNLISTEIHTEIKKEYETNGNVLNLVEFLTKDNCFIIKEMQEKNPNLWFEMPILTIRDSNSQYMCNIGSNVSFGITLTSSHIVIDNLMRKIEMPISQNTRFLFMNSFFDKGILVEGSKIEYSIPNGYRGETITGFLNDVLDKIRKSKFYDKSEVVKPVHKQPVQEQPVVEQLESIKPITQNVGPYSVKSSYSEMCAFINGSYFDSAGVDIISNSNRKFSKKVANAINAYAFEFQSSDVFALYDETLFGSGKEGFVMSPNGIKVKNAHNTLYCSYTDIKEIKVVCLTTLNAARVYLVTKYGDVHIAFCSMEEKGMYFAQSLNKIFKKLFGLDTDPFTIEKQ